MKNANDIAGTESGTRTHTPWWHLLLRQTCLPIPSFRHITHLTLALSSATSLGIRLDYLRLYNTLLIFCFFTIINNIRYGALGGIRTHTISVLSRLPLPIGVREHIKGRFYIFSHSSIENFFISVDLRGKLYLSHHLRIALSETPNCFPIYVNGVVLINCFNSSRVTGISSNGIVKTP